MKKFPSKFQRGSSPFIVAVVVTLVIIVEVGGFLAFREALPQEQLRDKPQGEPQAEAEASLPKPEAALAPEEEIVKTSTENAPLLNSQPGKQTADNLAPCPTATATGCKKQDIPPATLESETATERANSETGQPVTSVNSDEPPLKLKSIGVNLDYYDPAANRAGDFAFTKSKLSFGLLFFDYGHIIPAEKSASGRAKANPQPTFILPMGTKVRSLVDGVVVAVPTLYSGDYSIHVAESADSNWRYETEHVSNPLVKVGDRVSAGQVIAEVSPHDSANNSGFGLVEIGILKGGGRPEHICPFAHLDPSIADEVKKKILAFYKSWEEYIGITNLYNESALVSPGCLTSEPIEG